jgi:putative PEP-CTERM system histidine kinase
VGTGSVEAFLVGIFIVIAAALLIRPVRSRVSIFFTKALFRYKYDYRREWLRFIGTLSDSDLEQVPKTSIRAVAQIVGSPAGIVWVQAQDEGSYSPLEAWNCGLPTQADFEKDSSLAKFLQKSQWVIDLHEFHTHRRRYGELQLDGWLERQDAIWLIVPMLLGTQLYGFIALEKGRPDAKLNFEDHDLLRTVGRHVATHIKQAESDRRLSESSQLDTYHRLSAFLMHDLNNLVAQQSLVVSNADKFRHEPKFVDDTITTIANSVTRMKRIMEQLSNNSRSSKQIPVGLSDVLKGAVSRNRARKPIPELIDNARNPLIIADPERLSSVFEHLVRNAQDATGDEGSIKVTVERDDIHAIITVEDDGAGMTQEFISQRLFRPFDSTKGSESMGIGAFQAREYVRMLGGRLEVASEVGKGTRFRIRLPLADKP